MATETKGMTFFRMIFSGYAGHVTKYLIEGTLFSRLLVVGFGLGLDLVSGWLAVMHTYCTAFRCRYPAVNAVESMLIRLL